MNVPGAERMLNLVARDDQEATLEVTSFPFCSSNWVHLHLLH